MTSTTQVFVGIGSNLGNPRQQVAQACKALAKISSTKLIAFSPWYESDPVGPPGQPDYINGAAWLETSLEPLAFLDQLQAIENAQQRERKVRWGPRTLDLDLLLYGNNTLNLPRLQVPHPHMTERAFVLRPLLDLNPSLTLPNGVAIASLLAQLNSNGLRPLPDLLNEHA